MLVVWPKLYNDSPVMLTPVRMDALWMVRVGIPRARARRERSVCVVALGIMYQYRVLSLSEWYDKPEGIANDEKGNVFRMGIRENCIA
jgi:hypothetical protein